MKKLLAVFFLVLLPSLAVTEEISDFGDYRSSTLVNKAWKALEDNDLEAVIAYTDKCLELYATPANDMQAGLTDYAVGTNENIFKYWALNDTGTALFILGEAYRNAGQYEQANQTYKRLINDYFYAQCWDPRGWFWKPAEAAQQQLIRYP
ncbi:MAG: tetratricopeptide repeat protein [Candidatus Omnitrophica bacterium]|nr:tetratricopeptide repeat protein [Candidatus Omnitrophota bacterium]